MDQAAHMPKLGHDPAAVAMHDAPDIRQPDSCSLEFIVSMEALKYAE